VLLRTSQLPEQARCKPIRSTETIRFPLQIVRAGRTGCGRNVRNEVFSGRDAGERAETVEQSLLSPWHVVEPKRMNKANNIEDDKHGQPLLTVVVPSYNTAAYLPRCLKSFEGTHDGKIEVIVVDNVSQDGSADIVAAYSHLVSRFISEPDRGQSDALNKGFAAARGRYVCWMNSDDEFVSGAVSRLVQTLASATGHWYSAGMIWIDEESRITKCSPAMPRWFPLPQLGATGVGTPSCIMSRETAIRAGPFDEKLNYCMDTDMWWRLHSQGVALLQLPYYVWAFRVHPLSKTSHVHLQSNPNDAMATERELISDRYALSFGRRAGILRAIGTRWVGAISGRDILAYWDTMRYRGKRADDVAACR